MTASKSGNNIVVDGTGNTLASIYTDINDPTFFSRTDMGGWYKYTVENGTVSRALVVNYGAVLTIGNEADYSFKEKLSFNPGANGRGALQVNVGGELRVFGNVTITFSETAYYSGVSYWYGKTYFRGNDTYRPLLYKIFQLTLNSIYGQAPYYDYNIWDWDKVDIKDFSLLSSTSTVISLYPAKIKSASLTNIHIIGSTAGGSNWSGIIYITGPSASIGGLSRVILENWEVEHCYTIVIREGAKVKNFNVHHNWYYGFWTGPANVQALYKSENTIEALWADVDYEQTFPVADGCQVSDCYLVSSNAHGIVLDQGTPLFLENCTISAAVSNVIVRERTSLLIGDNNVFNAPTMVSIDGLTGGCAVWVKKLTLTVQDSEGNPIEGATVVVNQKDGKEKWRFTTEADGTPRTLGNLNKKIILVWREQTNNAGTTFTYWSDPSNNTYHEIIVSKPGYQTAVEHVQMNAHRTVIVTLYKDTSRRTQGHIQGGFVPFARKAT